MDAPPSASTRSPASISYDLPYSLLRDNLVQELFWHEETGRLGFLVSVRNSDVESMYVEIPDGHWGQGRWWEDAAKNRAYVIQ